MQNASINKKRRMPWLKASACKYGGYSQAEQPNNWAGSFRYDAFKALQAQSEFGWYRGLSPQGDCLFYFLAYFGGMFA